MNSTPDNQHLIESVRNFNLYYFQAQDTCESLTAELITTKKKLSETEEEKQRLETESQQVLYSFFYILTLFRQMEFSIKLHTLKSGRSIIYI